MEITQSMEEADQNVQKLKGSEPNLRVSEISLGPTSKFCYRCGSDQHRPKDCCFREAECRNCKKKKGHLARMCQSKARISQKNPWKNPEQTRANLAKVGSTPKEEAKWESATIEESQWETEPFLNTTILNIGSHSSNPITVQLELNGKEILIEVDTGAAVTLMSETTHKKLFPVVKLKNSTVNLQIYT